MKTVITIGRQFGSGGKEIGIRVAKELGIPFYDDELLQEAAKKSGLCEKVFESFDERPKSLLYSIAVDSFMFGLPGTTAGESLEQQVYLATFETIRNLAAQGPCVIIGRCADYILKDREDCLHVFIHSDMEHRAARIVEKYGHTKQTPQKRLTDKDNKRKVYYKHYTNRNWGEAQNYHLSLNSGLIGVEKCVDIIVDVAKLYD